MQAVWSAIDGGNPAWDIPAYNGGLFAADTPDGQLIQQLTIPDGIMLPVLQALLIDNDDAQQLGAIDFRSLSVREFGTIYEGLLESNLGIAEYDLTLDSNDTWVPAKPSDVVHAPKGSVYFHNTSGQRKGTGSYFTPAFVVEHLIERALIPALERHLTHIKELFDAGKSRSAGEQFFDFRVADLAMGSGHFLTAAIDHIENRMAAFLADTPIDRVSQELSELTDAAQATLPHLAFEIERSALLRRQIARRCIYGLDINPIAVELARVSIWIHTFVRGLPMSSLDHNLVCANSLTGIGTIDEALDVLLPKRRAGQVDMMEQQIRTALEQAKYTIQAINANSEADIAATRNAQAQLAIARAQAQQAKLLFDAAVLMRIGQRQLVNGADPDEIAQQAQQPVAQAALAHLNPAHMPVLFPEVFLRANGGFDVLLGNPPWEEVMVEEPKFWLRVRPGLLGLSASQMRETIQQLRDTYPYLVKELQKEVTQTDVLRHALLKGPYPDLGIGDVDLYRVFAWRNWHLLRQNGFIGAVFPRSLFAAKGNTSWRQLVLSNSISDVTLLSNQNEWIFENVDGRYSISLFSTYKSGANPVIQLNGPFFDYTAFKNHRTNYGILPASLILNTGEGSVLPRLPDAHSTVVFLQLRKSPNLDSTSHDWDFRAIREFDATNDRPTFDAGAQQPSFWPVYGGSSFNLWEPITGATYAYADPQTVTEALFTKRQRQVNIKSSAFYGMPSSWANNEQTLACRHPRVAFRDVTNATNSRTLIACLIPANTILTNKAPWLFNRPQNYHSEAYLLGVLSSIPLDWFARRYVEMNVNFHIFNSLPIPRPHADDPRRLRVIEIAGRLAAVDARYQTWADAVGVPVGSVTSAALKDDLIAELDALVAHLYGLNRSQLCHIFATFHRGWAYQPRLAQVLSFYDQLPEVLS